MITDAIHTDLCFAIAYPSSKFCDILKIKKISIGIVDMTKMYFCEVENI